MTIPLLISVIALAVAWRYIRTINKEIVSLYFDNLEKDKKYNMLLGEKTKIEYFANEARESYSLAISSKGREVDALLAELRRKHRKVVA